LPAAKRGASVATIDARRLGANQATAERNIGPIAKVVITRAAVEGVTLQEFLTRVASSVLIETARTRFVREAGAEFSAEAPQLFG
jgi:hypothetical protein